VITAEEIARALDARRVGQRWWAKCPSHEEKTASFSISEKDGRVLLHCFGGCPQESIIGALRERGLWPSRERTSRHEGPHDPDRRADLQRAEYWRLAAGVLVDQLLEKLPPTDPDRCTLTSLHRRLQNPVPDSLLAEYRTWRSVDPHLTAALTHAGRLHEARVQRLLAEWISELSPPNYPQEKVHEEDSSTY
jgi:hypothetical protein